jgi:hypothetical protein
MVCDGLLKWFLVFFVSMWLALMVDRLLLLPRRCKRIYRELLTKGLETELAWSEAGLVWRNNRGSVQFPWNDYASRQENKSVLLLYRTTFGPGEIIPKSALNAAQWDTKWDTIRRYLDAIPIKQ